MKWLFLIMAMIAALSTGVFITAGAAGWAAWESAWMVVSLVMFIVVSNEKENDEDVS